MKMKELVNVEHDNENKAEGGETTSIWSCSPYINLLLSRAPAPSFANSGKLDAITAMNGLNWGCFEKTDFNLNAGCSADAPFLYSGPCKPWAEEERDALFDSSWKAARVLIVLSVASAVASTAAAATCHILDIPPSRLMMVLYVMAGVLALLTLIGLNSSMCKEYCLLSSQADCLRHYSEKSSPTMTLQAYCRSQYCQVEEKAEEFCSNLCPNPTRRLDVGTGPYAQLTCTLHCTQDMNDVEKLTNETCVSECTDTYDAKFDAWCAEKRYFQGCHMETFFHHFFCMDMNCKELVEANKACKDICNEKGACGVRCQGHFSSPDCNEVCLKDFCASETHMDRVCEDLSCSFDYGAGLVLTAGLVYLWLALRVWRRQAEADARVALAPVRRLPSDIDC